jgi:excisionase family DNA binding protein
MIRDPLSSPGKLMGADSSVQEEMDLPAVITVEELATLLRISRNSAYKAISNGQIPGVIKAGRAIRISRNGVLELLRGKDHVPRSERSNL